MLTELDSLYGVGFLKASNLEMPHHRVTSRMAVDGEELPRDPNGKRMCSVTDGDVFYREDELSGHSVLRSITDGKDLDCPDPQLYRNHYADLLIGSNLPTPIDARQYRGRRTDPGRPIKGSRVYRVTVCA